MRLVLPGKCVARQEILCNKEVTTKERTSCIIRICRSVIVDDRNYGLTVSMKEDTLIGEMGSRRYDKVGQRQ